MPVRRCFDYRVNKPTVKRLYRILIIVVIPALQIWSTLIGETTAVRREPQYLIRLEDSRNEC